jgi:hypothetical protein
MDVLSGTVLSDESLLLFVRVHKYNLSSNAKKKSLAFVHIRFVHDETDYTYDLYTNENLSKLKDYIGYYGSTSRIPVSAQRGQGSREVIIEGVLDDNSVVTLRLKGMEKKSFVRKGWDIFYLFFTAIYQTTLVLLIFPYFYSFCAWVSNDWVSALKAIPKIIWQVVMGPYWAIEFVVF